MGLAQYTNAVAVITGGASGIGLATAHALRAAGAHIVLADINAEGLQRASAELQAQHADATSQVRTVVTDVTDEAQVRALMREAESLTGRLDLVVASAGIGRGGSVETMSVAEMQLMLNINVIGIYSCVQAALPTMQRQHSGHFVLLSSVAGKLGAALLTGYCASKWAVRGFSIALRTELYGTGIGVTTVYPAWVETPMVHQENMQEQLPNLQVLLTTEQVANEILRAVQADQRDLTLAPNRDIARLIELTKVDPDLAEDRAGEAFYRQTHAATPSS